MLPKYRVIDLETSVKNRGDDSIGRMLASPFHPDNRIVMCGQKEGSSYWIEQEANHLPPDGTMLVGQNIKFDLLYLLEYPAWTRFIQDNIDNVWDTMVVEYLIHAQSEKMVGLDALSESYGGELKDDKIKEYWDNGIDTEDIPTGELARYLKGDLDNTDIIFRKQWEIVNEMGLLPLVRSQMEALVALAIMEHNGMHFDKAIAHDKILTLTDEYDKLKELLDQELNRSGNLPYEGSVSSNKDLSLYLFGGDVTTMVPMPVFDSAGNPIVYKSGARKGEVRTKKTPVMHTVVPLYTSPKPKGKSGYYPVGDDVLREVADSFTHSILYLRDLQKQLNTYFKGYSDMVWPDGCIHPNYIQCRTDTGRLSCTQPNLQNATSKKEE